jgi:3-phosphoshikimate 1-carboxyvinyltransferase
MGEATISGSLVSRPSGPLAGDITVPGDKSISHRALMVGAMAAGRTTISGLLEGDDVLATASALRALGVPVAHLGDASYEVHGVGIGGLAEPEAPLDLGNSGTGARLLIGLLATHRLSAHITGDSSLRGRPMGRVIAPLASMGAIFEAREGGRLPLLLKGAHQPAPITYRLPVASAQVKSAILLAGLNTPGVTTVIEPEPTRDHSELMLRHFGAELAVRDANDGRHIAITGQPELMPQRVAIPGDPSSAAFVAVAALISPGSAVTIRGIGVNALRTGLYVTLGEMGADLEFSNEREEAGEPVADLTVKGSPLRGVAVPAERVPSMIDEYPVLAVAGAFAEGPTTMHGLAELRIKESDRIRAIAGGLEAIGVTCHEGDDTLTVEGRGAPPAGGATVESFFDHRIAMAFLVAGIACAAPVRVTDAAAINTSFPGFAELMNGLGADLAPAAP